jgi:hypothetical protein
MQFGAVERHTLLTKDSHPSLADEQRHSEHDTHGETHKKRNS